MTLTTLAWLAVAAYMVHIMEESHSSTGATGPVR